MFLQGTTSSLNETFALVSLAGFAVQRAVEILDPLFVGLLYAAKQCSATKELPLGVSDGVAKGWMTALAAFLLSLLLVDATHARLPAMNTFDWHGWDAFILALAISAGANGLNSVLKFGEYVKESRKVEARPLPVITIAPPAPKVSRDGKVILLASVSGADIKDVRWKVLDPQGGGAITSDGIYTAPPQAGTYYVAATSVANPEAVASVAVTVT